jgi:hypothetical protein
LSLSAAQFLQNSRLETDTKSSAFYFSRNFVFMLKACHKNRVQHVLCRNETWSQPLSAELAMTAASCCGYQSFKGTMLALQ